MSDTASDSAVGMPCPHCRVDLVMSDRQGIEIDYCPKCRGVWLDRGELDKIIERSAQYSATPPKQPSANPPAQSPWTASNSPPPGRSQGYDPGYQSGHGGHGNGHSGGQHSGGYGRHRSFLGRLFDD